MPRDCPAPLTPWELQWESGPRAQGHREGDAGQRFGSSSVLLVGWRKPGTEEEKMGGNILPNDGEMPWGLCFSRSTTRIFRCSLHGQGKEEDNIGDGEGETTRGEARAGLALTTQASQIQQRLTASVQPLPPFSPPEKGFTKGLS